MVEPMFGSIVQKGKFADCAFPELIQLKRVDLPTFGRPTMPHLSAIYLIFKILGCKNRVNFLNCIKIMSHERDTPAAGYVLEC
jgi:hypothetical protein